MVLGAQSVSLPGARLVLLLGGTFAMLPHHFATLMLLLLLRH